MNAVHLHEEMEQLSISRSFNRVWLHFQKQGKMYGYNSITHFMGDIAEIFEHGDINKGANMNADILQVELQIIYLVGYSLPQVPYIKSYAGQMMNKKRARTII